MTEDSGSNGPRVDIVLVVLAVGLALILGFVALATWIFGSTSQAVAVSLAWVLFTAWWLRILRRNRQ